MINFGGGGGSNGMATSSPGMFGDGGGTPMYSQDSGGLRVGGPSGKKTKKKKVSAPVKQSTQFQRKQASKKRVRRSGNLLVFASPGRAQQQAQDKTGGTATKLGG